jgi:predicted amidohydrolase
VKIALGQLNIRWEDKAANLEKIEAYLKMLSAHKTDLFLLPEMSLTGFSMHTEVTKEQDRYTVAQIQKLAKTYGVAIGVGWVKDAGELCENHYSIVTPQEELLDYAKLHPFRYGGETEYFQGGSQLPVCMYQNVCLGVQICYDLRFPEPFQILSRKADLILVPANWPERRREHWMTLLKARAIENMVYIAAINCAGDMGGQYYSGDSGLYAPDGTFVEAKEIRLEEACPEERVLCYEWKNDVDMYRQQFPMKEDRREELYRRL